MEESLPDSVVGGENRVEEVEGCHACCGNRCRWLSFRVNRGQRTRTEPSTVLKGKKEGSDWKE
jgi:hypothetical protein